MLEISVLSLEFFYSSDSVPVPPPRPSGGSRRVGWSGLVGSPKTGEEGTFHRGPGVPAGREGPARGGDGPFRWVLI